MRARKLILAFVLIWVIGIGIGCGKLKEISEEAQSKAKELEDVGEEKPVSTPAPAPQQPAPQIVTPTPEDLARPLAEEAQRVLVKKTEEFVYDPINRVDPFEPLKLQTEEEKTKGIEIPQSEYMGRYELRSLKLVAIVWGAVEPRAMFETPDGKAYSVKVGDIFSRDAAQVLSITPEGVLVQVASKTLTGEVTTQKLMIKLKPEEEEREVSESFLGFGAGSRRPEVKPEGY